MCALGCLVALGFNPRVVCAQARAELPTETVAFSFEGTEGAPVVAFAFDAPTLFEVGTCHLPGASGVGRSTLAVRQRGGTASLAEGTTGEEGCPRGVYLSPSVGPGEYEVVVSCQRGPCSGQLAYRVHGDQEWHTLHEPHVGAYRTRVYPHAEAIARGFVAANAAGGGAVLSAMAYYQSDVLLFVRVGGQVALTGGERGPIHRASGWGLVGANLGLGFALAFGFGAATVSPRPSDNPTVDVSPIVVGAARIGQPDDTRLWLQLQGWDAGPDLAIASVQGDLAICVAPDLELGLQGAGGFDGIAFGEAYVRARVDILDLRLGAGVAAAFAQRLCVTEACPEVVHYVGPSLGLGIGLRGW